jgi:hypothetical protein
LLEALGKPLPFAFLAAASFNTLRAGFFEALACLDFFCFFLAISWSSQLYRI